MLTYAYLELINVSAYIYVSLSKRIRDLKSNDLYTIVKKTLHNISLNV